MLIFWLSDKLWGMKLLDETFTYNCMTYKNQVSRDWNYETKKSIESLILPFYIKRI